MSQYLLNCWYQAGWSHEIGEQGLSRVLLDRRVFFWRCQNGAIAALDDRCPHRFAPLSRGELKDDMVTCGYHGLTFGADGVCVRGLLSNRIPPNTRVRSYPAVERDSIVWFWPGDPSAADESLIPDFSFLRETAGCKPYFGYVLVQVNYQIETDNLLDSTHIELVHRGTFGGRGIMQKSRLNIRKEEPFLHVNFWVDGMTSQQVWPEPVPPAESYDRWVDMRWSAPCIMRLNVGTVPHGAVAEEGLHEQFPGLLQAHILTPETSTSTHYFWALQDALSEDRQRDAQQAGGLGPILQAAFSREDQPMLEAVQRNMKGTDLWAERPVILETDRGAVMARRLLEKLIRNEQQARAGTDRPVLAEDCGAIE